MGLGDHPAERVDARDTLNEPRKMVEMEQQGLSGRVSPGWVLLICTLLLLFFIGVVIYRASTAKPVAATSPAPQEEQPPPDPPITMKQVTDNVFHLEFDGEYCDTVQCLKRATGLVLEQAPGHRIASIAPVGVYGSTTLVVVTIPTTPVP